jgi:predicted aldo/keto reductase-like oxidoreductase
VLGFGTGRLPTIGESPDPGSGDEATGMLRFAIDQGVNYVDLPYLYDTARRERLESFIGRALQGRHRQKIKIAASLPAARIKSADDLDRHVNGQLKRLGTDRLDFFLLGGLNRLNWPELPVEEVLRRAEALQKDGRIGSLGFSFHDDFQTLRTIVEAYDKWSLCQFQYSFMDIDHHPGAGGLRYAADKGLAVVAAEPLKGGRLTSNLPGPVARIWAGATRYSPAGWGLRWVWNHPEVATVVSDMSTLAQVKENIVLADTASADSFTVSDELLINRIRDAYRSSRPLACTACRGCMPCPLGIDAPRIFELYNDAVMYGDAGIPRSIYRDEGHCAEVCNECGLCIKACGFQFPIPEWLEKARRLLADN